MTKQTEALRMAIAEMVRAEKVFDDIGLLLIKFGVKPSDISFHKESFLAPSIQACKEALEQPAQEPVAWVNRDDLIMIQHKHPPISREQIYESDIPLYTHPAPSWQGNKEFVGLSDDEIDSVWFEVVKENNFEGTGKYFARAIEQALKEKNT